MYFFKNPFYLQLRTYIPIIECSFLARVCVIPCKRKAVVDNLTPVSFRFQFFVFKSRTKTRACVNIFRDSNQVENERAANECIMKFN